MIREAVICDLPFVYECLCDLEHTVLDKESFANGYLRQLRDASIVMFLQEEHGVRQGYCSVRMLYHLHHAADIAMVEELYVCEEQRGKGIGSALMQHAIAYAKHKGCIQLEVSSSKQRLAAHEFYRHLHMECNHYKFTRDLDEV